MGSAAGAPRGLVREGQMRKGSGGAGCEQVAQDFDLQPVAKGLLCPWHQQVRRNA